jgi:hypothetical protein
MGKRRRPTDRSNTKQGTPASVTESSLARTHKKLLELFGGLATLLTIAGFVLSYLVPKLSVDIAGSLQPTSPTGTLFYLSNDGSLPIHDVKVTCGNLEITGQGIRVTNLGAEFPPAPEATAEMLSPGHKLTLPYAPAFGFTGVSTLTGAQLVIRAHYRPDWVFWHRTDTFPFQAIRGVDGSWIWRQLPR